LLQSAKLEEFGVGVFVAAGDCLAFFVEFGWLPIACWLRGEMILLILVFSALPTSSGSLSSVAFLRFLS
jgi:hypothetical protein